MVNKKENGMVTFVLDKHQFIPNPPKKKKYHQFTYNTTREMIEINVKEIKIKGMIESSL